MSNSFSTSVFEINIEDPMEVIVLTLRAVLLFFVIWPDPGGLIVQIYLIIGHQWVGLQTNNIPVFDIQPY